MTGIRLHRRALMGALFAGTAGLGAYRATAQVKELNDLLGIDLPPEMLKLLPEKPLNLVRTIHEILELEKEADNRGLPISPLSDRQNTSIPATQDSIYQAAMPRLVAIIDRAESGDPGLADRAGSMLAELNASQRVVPEAYRPPVPGVKPIPLSRNRDFATLKAEYRRLFDSVAVRDTASDTIEWHLKAMLNGRKRYEAVGSLVSVPWYFIAVIHGLEASFNFRAHLHNGDFPLTARTRQVPSGRPLVWLPPDDWASSAKDALRLLGFVNQSDWSLERTLYRLEAYNGFGYRRLGVASPYLWSLCTHYDRGKFVADGKWNAKARSQQAGAAVLLWKLAQAKEIPL